MPNCMKISYKNKRVKNKRITLEFNSDNFQMIFSTKI